MDIPTMKIVIFLMTCSLVAEAISLDTVCADGRYGLFCDKTCERCKTCDKDTGHCTSCKPKWFGSICQHSCYKCLDKQCEFKSGTCSYCTNGYYGAKCNITCPDKCGNSSCNKTSGRCSYCSKGYYGEQCNNKCADNCADNACAFTSGKCDSCTNGYFGKLCNQKCPDTCGDSMCDRYLGKCSKCIPGQYGNFCNKTCSSHCQNHTCNITKGLCDNCIPGMYGLLCDHECSSNCKTSFCNRSDGNCTNGCTEHFTGNTCKLCHQGKYGNDCDLNCPPNCLHGECIRYNGACKRGCKAGFSDTKFCCVNNLNCKSCSSQTKCTQCTNGTYGIDCGKPCPINCDSTCNRITGHCNRCKPNYFGRECEFNCSNQCLMTKNESSRCSSENGSCISGCIANFYGNTCERNCSEHCNVSCDQQSGECNRCQFDRFGRFCEHKCSHACVRHGDGIKCDRNDGICLHGCLTGFYGDRCNNNCSVGCHNRYCNGSTGQCLLGCTEGFSGALCVPEQSGGFPTTIVGIAVGVLVALAIVVGIVTCIYRKRVPSLQRHPLGYKDFVRCSEGVVIERCSIPDKLNADHLPMTKRSDNAVETGQAGMCHNTPTGEDNDIEDDDIFVPDIKHVDEKEENTYYNFVNPNSKLRTKELYRFLSKSDENYQQEFRMLPVGLIKPCKDAKLSQNTRRNRYNMVYPYDDTRVKVNDGKSDYINASYIDGYKKKNAYIACLGPTKDTLGDFSLFWKMIWQEKVETIVMVTKLNEVSGMKCDQYWPNSGKTMRYGQVSVRSTGEEEYAEFVVRNMTLSMNHEERQFHHIHFTAWPDKGVPSDVISIINLRNKVTRMRRKFDGPLVVHCSAGIGRTGTYIALDILIHLGLADQSIDVLGCIMNMRQQRVHMVQTVEQYKYLHHALLWSLSIDTQPVPSDRYYDLAWVYKDDGLAKMLRQLQMENWYDTVEEKSAVEANKNISLVNRKNADIPGYRHAVKMLARDRNKSMGTEYINAVFIDGYRRQNQFIAAQTPLPETVPTFLDMVVQQLVICIIDLEPNTNQDDVGEYLPDDNDEIQNGNDVFRAYNKKDVGAYVKRELELVTDKQEQDKRTITHYQFTQWPRSEIVPDSLQFVKLIHEVDKLVIQTGQSGPILVHCMNGAKRSALFCAMWLLIERIGADNSVSVLNTLRQVKSRRRSALPNKEQIDFCFNGIVTHLNQLNLNVYSNT